MPLGVGATGRPFFPSRCHSSKVCHRSYSTNGAPSTHILKPEKPEYLGGAANEAWCMRLAKACRLTTVDVEVLSVDGTPVFAVSRYDRAVIDGTVERTHQEDMCQALSIETFDSRAKYGVHNAKRMTLRAIAGVLEVSRWRCDG
jgi:serine/threonine protein kinase HipA of HipAB toxin-antitoxin module